ncbi:MAG: hypothetical protein J1E61_08145 [Lachnospiraceae bacterium]|nr:hypothetical protein [Lachnospiraceae bacterium]
MNFYIGNSIAEFHEQNRNVEFSDELIDFIYRLKGQAEIDMSTLYEIDPYADVEISVNDLSQIIDICHYILKESLIQDYEDPIEGEKMLKELSEMAKEAASKGMGLLSIGD